MRAENSVVHEPGSLGIIIGGFFFFKQKTAYEIAGVRAAVAWTEETAQLARLHNNANVLSLGARMYSVEDAVSFARVFVNTEFSGESRHARRLAMITDYEATGKLPPLPAEA